MGFLPYPAMVALAIPRSAFNPDISLKGGTRVSPHEATLKRRQPDNQDKHGQQRWQTRFKLKSLGSLNDRPHP
jgi:hypothetical protein